MCIPLIDQVFGILLIHIGRSVSVDRECLWCAECIARHICSFSSQCINIIHILAKVSKGDNLSFCRVGYTVHSCCIHSTLVDTAQTNNHIVSVEVDILQSNYRSYHTIICGLILDSGDLDSRLCHIYRKGFCIVRIRYIACHICSADGKGIICVCRVADGCGMGISAAGPSADTRNSYSRTVQTGCSRNRHICRIEVMLCDGDRCCTGLLVVAVV